MISAILWNSTSDFMKKFAASVQKKPNDNVEQLDAEEQSSKRLKVTDELR